MLLLYCADRVIHTHTIRYQEIRIPRIWGRGSVLMLFWREELEQTRNPPNSCWQGGGAGTQSFCVVAQPSDSTLPGCAASTSSPSPQSSRSQPTILKGGKNNKLLKIIKKYHRKIVIITPGELRFASDHRAPPTFRCALPFRFLRALPHLSHLPYLHPSHPLDLPAEKLHCRRCLAMAV